MAKTIHIHLHGLARITKRTGDAGNFDESKHKRDKGGQFSSTGGGGGAKKPAKTESKAPASSSGAPNWSASNGNWDKAKKEGRELVQAKLQEAKTGGDRTDALLALKKQAEVEHKKGSYLAAVVIGEVNDYFDRVK